MKNQTLALDYNLIILSAFIHIITSMDFHSIYNNVISVPYNYGDLIINFLAEDKTLNFLQSIGIIIAIYAAFRTTSIARRIQRRHFREKHYEAYKEQKVWKHKKWVHNNHNTDTSEK